MITIIPNWHPMLVHFSIGLLAIAVVFYFAATSLPNGHRLKEVWYQVANWNLWTGCVITLLTVFAGWHAYNTVAHDAVSHAAMTLHRNWALPTALLFFIIGIAAVSLTRKNSKPDRLFLSTSAIAVIMLVITGWLGGEAVYRYGLGVMSLPTLESDTDGHDHRHGEAKQDTKDQVQADVEQDSHHDHNTHEHEITEKPQTDDHQSHKH